MKAQAIRNSEKRNKKVDAVVGFLSACAVGLLFGVMLIELGMR